MKFIDTNDLNLICNCNDNIIAVDTEFIRETDIKPILCLIQLATEKDVFIIDPIKIDISPLKQIFENPQIKKVFHDARQDIEILHLYGIDVQNYYDTQMAEMLVSVKEMESYRSLVLKYTGKKLQKNQTLSDWVKRPLTKKQILYAENDVLYLIDIYKQQYEKIKQLQRKSWLKDIMTQTASQTDTVSETLNNWCINRAKELGISPDKIAKPNLIHAITHKGLRFVKQLQNAREINKNEHTPEFLAFAATIVKDLDKSENRAKDVIYLLKSLLNICSRENDVCPALIANREDLEALANGDNENISCLTGWRFDIFGRYALELLSGKISLFVNNNEVVIK